MKLSIKKIFLFFVFLGLFAIPSVHAYQDEVDAPAHEVFEAVKEILTEEYLDKADAEKGIILSEWVEDRMVRKNDMIIVKTKKEFIRRTKYKILLKRWPTYTEITIIATFQFKPMDAKMSTPWRSLKPQRADREQEALLFRRILTQIEDKRRKN